MATSKNFEVKNGLSVGGTERISSAGVGTFTDLNVTGTTTTIDTATLQVQDKNIVINYGTGDTSSTASGAGITIQDAVDASNDATLLWDASADEFDFSHSVTAPSLKSTGAATFDSTFTSTGLLLSENTGLYTTNASLSYYSATNGVYINGAGNTGWLRLNASGAQNSRTAIDLYGSSAGDYIKVRAGNTDTMYFGAGGAGRVGIGTSSPATTLEVNSGTTNTAATFTSSDSGAGINLTDDSGTSTIQTNGANLRIGVDEDGAVGSSAIQFRVDGSTKATIQSGNLLIGQTAGNVYNQSSTTGFKLDGASGNLQIARDGGTTAFFNRLSSDGDIIDLRKDGSAVGTIGANAGRPYLVNNVDGGIHISTDGYGRALVLPADQTGAPEDNLHYLGSSSYRWRDLHLSGTANIDTLVGATNGSFAGKFAVKNSGVHGSFDFYNNGTTYLNGQTYVDDILNVTGSNAEIRAAGNIYLTGSNDVRIKLGDSGISGVSDSNNTVNIRGDNDYMKLNAAGNGGIIFEIDGTESMRIDSSGNVLVANTSYNNDTAGIGFGTTGFLYATRSSNVAASFGRLSDDGVIADFRRDTQIAGTLNSVVANRISLRAGSTAGYLGVGSTDYFAWNTTDFRPTADNSYDLGVSGARFDDIYATNATIQTSDQNEKNTITNSDLGLDFINRLSPKSYKFNSKTRTHYGLIAQDVETVLSDISKSTTDFAGFIKDDISEEQDGSSYRYGLRYNEFISPLIKAIQEQQEQIETLKQEVEELKGG